MLILLSPGLTRSGARFWISGAGVNVLVVGDIRIL
jgi:hypothetical protein